MYGKEEDSSVPSSFQILYFIAWKPHETQPKPVKRGSGEISFKELGKINEIIDKKKPNQD